MSIFTWLFGRKETATELFGKTVPYELGLESPVIEYDAGADSSIARGELTSRAWTFSAPTQARVVCAKERVHEICLYYTDVVRTTFTLEAGIQQETVPFDLTLSPLAAASAATADGYLDLGGGLGCRAKDIASVCNLAAELTENIFPRFKDGSLQSLRAGANEMVLTYRTSGPGGLDRQALYDDSRMLLKVLEQMRRLKAGEEPEMPDETNESFAQKLATVAPNAGLATAGKKREVSFTIGELRCQVLLDGKNDQGTIRAVLAVGEREGAFTLHNDHQARDDGKAHDGAWSEREMRVFFAKNAYVSSAGTRAEVRFLVSLGDEARAKIVGLCTKYDCSIAFDGTKLTIDFIELRQFLFYTKKGRGIDAAEVLLAVLTDMAEVAGAFPERGAQGQTGLTGTPSDLPQLTGCRFCRALFFRTPDTTVCIHCGAPANTAFEMATLQNEGTS